MTNLRNIRFYEKDKFCLYPLLIICWSKSQNETSAVSARTKCTCWFCMLLEKTNTTVIKKSWIKNKISYRTSLILYYHSPMINSQSLMPIIVKWQALNRICQKMWYVIELAANLMTLLQINWERFKKIVQRVCNSSFILL